MRIWSPDGWIAIKSSAKSFFLACMVLVVGLSEPSNMIGLNLHRLFVASETVPVPEEPPDSEVITTRAESHPRQVRSNRMGVPHWGHAHRDCSSFQSHAFLQSPNHHRIPCGVTIPIRC
jgi:hypothetical protein